MGTALGLSTNGIVYLLLKPDGYRDRYTFLNGIFYVPAACMFILVGGDHVVKILTNKQLGPVKRAQELFMGVMCITVGMLFCNRVWYDSTQLSSV